MSEYKFKAYDWTEIFTALRIKNKDSNEEAVALMRQLVEEAHRLAFEAEHLSNQKRGLKLSAGKQKRLARLMWAFRGHTAAMSKQKITYDAELWAGLLKVKPDSVFLGYFDKLFECMWT